MSSTTTCAVCGTPIKNSINDDLSEQQSCAVCGSTRRNIVVTPGSILINLSPFAFQWYAKDFYEAYKAYKKLKDVVKFSPALLTLLAQAIELAAKSMHVDQGKNDHDLRTISHDLIKACDPVILGKYGITITANEATELQKLSDLYEAKAFEYFWFLPKGTKRNKANPDQARIAGITHAITGRDDMPNEDIAEALLIKLLEPTMQT